MARADNDSWSITESVGATAIGAAALRAAETEREDRIIADQFAKTLVLATGAEFANPILQEGAGLAPQARAGFEALTTYMGLRTKFFDGFFTHAGEAGLRQAVILASGLDSRAWRLPWPEGAVVYEIDQPQVLEFKAKTLADHELRVAYAPVPVDLRHDWLTALIDAGFDPAAPTAWSAEGLLAYLPPQAQDQLFESITEYSAPGSRVAVETIDVSDGTLPSGMRELFAGQFPESEDRATEELIYSGPRQDPKAWLAEHGWEVLVTDSAELLADTGRLDKYGPEALEKFRRAVPNGELLAAELQG